MKEIAELTYSESLSELEGILQKMQSPDCNIDTLSAMTTRALGLLKHCKERLTKTDEEVRQCLSELG
ncbi:MAG: exodeoxyribonuclease VII small subunit [Clostridium sp.]|nr:exodeoxyribonuclease VII small subunit [Prevotella sp.]MCM1428883.1 exodeoxyribonuclease VII small subunit [Clostridium sp.]MCM1475262.1 exodeoxyribonuclease VII small subunit [Muribaculaceae bacterium]